MYYRVERLLEKSERTCLIRVKCRVRYSIDREFEVQVDNDY